MVITGDLFERVPIGETALSMLWTEAETHEEAEVCPRQPRLHAQTKS